MSTELFRAIMEEEENKDFLLEQHVQNQMQEYLAEGRSMRRLSMVAGGLAAGWGAVKISLDSLFAGEGIPFRVLRATVGFLEEYGVIDGATSNTTSIALVLVPVGVAALASFAGGALLVGAMTKMFVDGSSVERQYKSLERVVNERDRKAAQMETLKQNRIPESFKEFQKQLKEVDRLSERIMSEAMKLERQVVRHVDKLSDEEITAVMDYITLVKNGLVSNARNR